MDFKMNLYKFVTFNPIENGGSIADNVVVRVVAS